MTQDANSLLMGGGGKYAPLKEIGDTVSGVIDSEPRVEQQKDIDSGEPLSWPDGNPKMQIVVPLQTDEHEDENDDGIRNVYLQYGAQQTVKKAVREAGATGLAVGGRLTLTYTHDAPPKRAGFRGAKQYAASYVPPPSAANAALMADPKPAATAAQPSATAPAAQPATVAPGTPIDASGKPLSAEQVAALQAIGAQIPTA